MSDDDADKYFGRRLSNDDAALVMREHEAIQAEYGRLSTAEEAEHLVRRARSPKSPLHHLFEWDDRDAAEAYRLDQARGFIRAVYVVFKELPEQKPIRAIVNIVHDGKRGPMSMRRVLSNEDTTQQLLEDAQRDLQTWTARYESLRKLAGLRHVFAAVDRVIKRASARKRAGKGAQPSARV